MAIKGRNPNAKEKRHMDAVSQIGCIVCLNKGFLNYAVEIHHVYGKTKERRTFECPSLVL